MHYYISPNDIVLDLSNVRYTKNLRVYIIYALKSGFICHLKKKIRLKENKIKRENKTINYL